MSRSADPVSALLRRGLPPLVVVAGEEPLQHQEAADAVRAAARAQGFDERQILEVERGFDWRQVTEACNSLSLFATRRLIEVRVSGALGEEGAAALQQLAAQPPQDVCLLVLLGALDARARRSAWYTACERAGAVIYAWPIKAEEWPAWVAARARRDGVRLTDEALALLVERAEGNPLACAQDLRKLKLLAGEVEVDEAMLRTAVADSARYGVFDLVERLLLGDAAGALRCARRLREEGMGALEVLGPLVWNLRGVARAAAVYARSRDAAAACDHAGIPRPRQAGVRRCLERVRRTEPLVWLRQAKRVDDLAKSTGGEPAAWTELLTLIQAASGAAPARSRSAS